MIWPLTDEDRELLNEIRGYKDNINQEQEKIDLYS